MSKNLASLSRDCARVPRIFPAVDFELLRCGTEPEVLRVSRLLKTYGAFRIRNHGLSPRVTADCFQYAREFFNGPPELKNSTPLYSRFDTEKVGNKRIQKESVEFRFKSNAAVNNQSPSSPALSMCKHRSELLEGIGKALQLNFSLNRYREDYEDNFCLHYYPITQRAERNPAHKDFGLLTLIIQENAASGNGLEVADLTSTSARTSTDVNESAQFVPVHPEGDDIIILAGLSLQKLVGKATVASSVHRVMAASSLDKEQSVIQVPRYSVAYFVHSDAKIKLDIRGETAGAYLTRRKKISEIPT